MKRNTFRFGIFLAILYLITSLTSIHAQETTTVKGSSPGYYYVPASNVEQDSTSAAITLDIAALSGAFSYLPGIQVIFTTLHPNGNNDEITLRIKPLGAQRLLTRQGAEFGIGALDSGVTLTATYDGSNFIADYSSPPQFRYIEPTELMLTGNAYSLTDTSIPAVSTVPILFGLKAEATNTGNVTFNVNGGIDYPIFLSNGDLIPAGALLNGEFIFCIFTTIPDVGFRAINLRPARSLKGQLVATLEIPAGTYTSGGDVISGWAIESGITEVEVVDFPGGGFYGTMVTDGMIAFPKDQFSNSQLGWYLEVDNGTIDVFRELKLFGYSSSAFALEIVGTDDADVQFTMRWPAAGTFAGVDKIGLLISPFSNFTIANAYTFNLYVTEN